MSVSTACSQRRHEKKSPTGLAEASPGLASAVGTTTCPSKQNFLHATLRYLRHTHLVSWVWLHRLEAYQKLLDHLPLLSDIHIIGGKSIHSL